MSAPATTNPPSLGRESLSPICPTPTVTPSTGNRSLRIRKPGATRSPPGRCSTSRSAAIPFRRKSGSRSKRSAESSFSSARRTTCCGIPAGISAVWRSGWRGFPMTAAMKAGSMRTAPISPFPNPCSRACSRWAPGCWYRSCSKPGRSIRESAERRGSILTGA